MGLLMFSFQSVIKFMLVFLPVTFEQEHLALPSDLAKCFSQGIK